MRSYTAARRAATKEPVQFEVKYFVVEKDELGFDEEVEKTAIFTCRGDISALSMSEFARSADLDAESVEGAAILADVFREAFDDTGEYKRFMAFQAKYLEPDDLIDIMGGLIEDFTGRPTQQPSVSSPSSSTDGLGSKVTSLPGGFSVQVAPIASSA